MIGSDSNCKYTMLFYKKQVL